MNLTCAPPIGQPGSARLRGRPPGAILKLFASGSFDAIFDVL